MKRSFLALVMALCMLCGAGVAETIPLVNLDTALPVVNEPLDVTIAVFPQTGAQDFRAENNWMCQNLERNSGLNITWLIIDPSSAQERLALMLNSGDMPDAILGYSLTADDIAQYGIAGELFYPINNVIDYAPTFKAFLEENPTAEAALTAPDGNMYGFPAFSNIWSYKCRFFVNTAWLDNVGLESPKTLADFKDMLIAFRDQDANGNGDAADEIPWSGSWSEQNSERQFIAHAFGIVPNGGTNIAIDYSGDEPTICFYPYSGMYKTMLTFLNGLWSEKLLDPDMFTQPETQLQATVMEGTVGFTGMSAPYVYDPDRQEQWTAINALVDTEGDTPVFPGPNIVYTMSRFSINADCDDQTAAALANLADYFYTLEGWCLSTFGPEAGSALDWNNNGHYYDAETNAIQYNMPADMTSAWTHRITNLTIYSNPGFNSEGYDPYRLKYAELYPDSAVGQLYKNGIVNRKDEEDQQLAYGPYYVDPVPQMFFLADDLARINELKTPLDDYVASMEAKFITGEASIEDEFDAFLKTLEAYGVQEYQDIYTKYYEEYKANK